MGAQSGELGFAFGMDGPEASTKAAARAIVKNEKNLYIQAVARIVGNTLSVHLIRDLDKLEAAREQDLSQTADQLYAEFPDFVYSVENKTQLGWRDLHLRVTGTVTVKASKMRLASSPDTVNLKADAQAVRLPMCL